MEQKTIDMNELYSDSNFVKEICEADDIAVIKSLFEEKGLQLDDEAAEAFLQKTHQQTDDGILSEEELETVNGGFLVEAIVLGAACGVILAAGALAFYKYIIKPTSDECRTTVSKAKTKSKKGTKRV